VSLNDNDHRGEERMNAVNLELSLEETNLVLEALGAMPYVRVYTLVAKVQKQAQDQLRDSSQPGAAALEPDETSPEATT
jgi:hypothetical protein